MHQNIVVYNRDSVCVARGQIDGSVLIEAADAQLVLQRAVDLVGEKGGAVCLQPGDYPLGATLQLRSRVELQGSGRATRLLAQPGLKDPAILGRGLKHTSVSALAVHSAESHAASAGVVLDDCGDSQVRNVHAQGFADYGLWLRNNSFLCTIDGCSAADNAKANILADTLERGGRGGDWVPNLIVNCTTYRGGCGVEVRRAVVLNILGCQVYQPARYGFLIAKMSNSVLVSGCRTFQVELDAVCVDTSHEINISSNIFCWHRGHSLVFRDVCWGTASGNNFIDAGVRARDGKPVHGVSLEGTTRGVQVVGNAVFNWGDQVPMAAGIWEAPTCRNNLISGNNVNYCAEEGTVVARGAGSHVGDNVRIPREAHLGMSDSAVPDFDTERIDRFLRQ
jgi:hypothetical protein